MFLDGGTFQNPFASMVGGEVVDEINEPSLEDKVCSLESDIIELKTKTEMLFRLLMKE